MNKRTFIKLCSAGLASGRQPQVWTGLGWSAFSERVGATTADGFTDIMVGGAILPSLLHQDPRYFYQGTGPTGFRIRHAMLSPFFTRNDNGSSGPNYSTLGGVLASSVLATSTIQSRIAGPDWCSGILRSALLNELAPAWLRSSWLPGLLTRPIEQSHPLRAAQELVRETFAGIIDAARS